MLSKSAPKIVLDMANLLTRIVAWLAAAVKKNLHISAAWDIPYGMETKQSTLTVEQQKKLTMTGVSAVDAFSETGITLTVNGIRVQITGSHLKVLSFSEGSGNFAASGEISSVRYGAKGGFKKLFK